MSHKPKDLENLLKNKFGFQAAKNRSDDHRYFVLQLPGLPPIHTKISHSKKDIRARLAAKIARQMRVRGPFFDLMMKCKRDRQAYYQQIQTDPFPPFDQLL
jgi:hypothetical protein